MMNAASTILCGCLAVSAAAAGMLWFGRPGGVEEVPEPPVTPIYIIPQPVVESAVEPASVPIEIPQEQAIPEQDGPVQPIEERGEAMIFEMEALLLMPFDEAITHPFD